MKQMISYPDPRFSPEQIAFLEDLLINKACMMALLKARKIQNPEECGDCAARIQAVLEIIRAKREGTDAGYPG
jgi:hypothetical protein